MKKIILGMAIFSSVAMGAEKANVYLKTGADLWQKFNVVKDEDIKANKKEADDFGYEITTEITREIYPNLELGLGLSYQEHGKPKQEIIDGDFYKIPEMSSIPVYLTAKYNIPTEMTIKPYLKADFGYSFNKLKNDKIKYGDINNSFFDGEVKAEIKDGAYFGIGTGFEYNNFTADIMYKINKAKLKAGDEDYMIKKDIDYSRVTLSVGYKFNL